MLGKTGERMLAPMRHRLGDKVIETESALRELLGEPTALVCAKVTDKLNPLTVPKLGILVDIDSAYTQCSKAFLRSHLWDASRFLPREALPSNTRS